MKSNSGKTVIKESKIKDGTVLCTPVLFFFFGRGDVMQIDVLEHASIRLENGIVIYIDPYDIGKEYHDADYIFITHDHYDHYDEKSIQKVRKDTTKIIVPECLKDKGYNLVVQPGKDYKIGGISFQAIAAYNTKAAYHPKEANYVGYNILVGGLYYYIMGDTNRTAESLQVECDVCFVPIGGTYTMDFKEAADCINEIEPMMAIPIHYGKIVGDLSLGKKFEQLVHNTKVIEMIKENEK